MADNDRLAPAERRGQKRFRIEQDLTFRIISRKADARDGGAGRTVDISSRGLLFRTGQPLQSGQRLEMSVNWPALLSGTCPLKFVATGRVLRADGGFAAVTIEQYEFRTRRTRELPGLQPSDQPAM